VNLEGLRIRTTEPVRLRDYFRRLGADAEIVANGNGSYVVVTESEVDIDSHVASWARINGLEATVDQQPKPARVTDLRRPRARLGDLLLRKGMITETQLAEGLRESQLTGDLLGRILLRHQWIFEDELARSLAEQLHLPYINLRNAGVDYSVARVLPVETGVRFAVIPIAVHRDTVRVAFADPCDDGAFDAVAQTIDNFDPVVAELSDIETAWRTVARRYQAA
jgi:hypothetical protein